MKRFATVSVVLLLMISLGVLFLFYLHHVKGEIDALLSQAEVSVSMGDFTTAQGLCEDSLELWEKAEPVLVLCLSHSEVDEMTATLTELSGYTASMDATMTTATIGKARGILSHLYETQLPYWYHILHIKTRNPF